MCSAIGYAITVTSAILFSSVLCSRRQCWQLKIRLHLSRMKFTVFHGYIILYLENRNQMNIEGDVVNDLSQGFKNWIALPDATLVWDIHPWDVVLLARYLLNLPRKH